MKVGCAIDIPDEYNRYLQPYKIELNPSDPQNYFFTLSLKPQPALIANFIISDTFYQIVPYRPLPINKFKYKYFDPLVSNYYKHNNQWPIFQTIINYYQQNKQYPSVRTSYDNIFTKTDLTPEQSFEACLVEYARDFSDQAVTVQAKGFYGVAHFVVATSGDLEM